MNPDLSPIRSVDGSIVELPSAGNPTALYKIEWTDTQSERKQVFQSETPFSNLQAETENDGSLRAGQPVENGKPAFEVTTQISDLGSRSFESICYCQ